MTFSCGISIVFDAIRSSFLCMQRHRFPQIEALNLSGIQDYRPSRARRAPIRTCEFKFFPGQNVVKTGSPLYGVD